MSKFGVTIHWQGSELNVWGNHIPFDAGSYTREPTLEDIEPEEITWHNGKGLVDVTELILAQLVDTDNIRVFKDLIKHKL